MKFLFKAYDKMTNKELHKAINIYMILFLTLFVGTIIGNVYVPLSNNIYVIVIRLCSFVPALYALLCMIQCGVLLEVSDEH